MLLPGFLQPYSEDKGGKYYFRNYQFQQAESGSITLAEFLRIYGSLYEHILL